MNLRSFIIVLFSVAGMLAFLSSCDKGGERSPDANSVEANLINNKGSLLVTVNNHEIYSQELTNTLTDMFGEYQAATLDEAGRKKALESLVASRAMADISRKELSPEQLLLIKDKSKRYQENLLINAYVKQTVTPEPVTNKMVEDYYNSHLEKFGQQVIRRFELVSTTSVLPAELRDQFLNAFKIVEGEKIKTGKAKNNSLKELSEKLTKQGYQLQYHKGVIGGAAIQLQAKIRDFIQAQKLNIPSAITFIEGKAYMVNIYSESIQPAKNLSVVSKDIRKSLAMIQFKKAIKGLSETALKQSNVVYHGDKRVLSNREVNE